ncbi:MAG TPA: alanyl-tRNA editing protein [Candidatus Eisenbacteria bacterium]|nr:alanyl-tRNA editing protein [Candidatus Eisenbacteria bacterium]
MTRRLYYDDSLLRSFEASVTAVREREGAPEAALEATAFYPGGGGQPADRGTLGSSAVLDVLEEGGVVWHRLDAPLSQGALVVATLDWARRFDHMQQHTGQHVLSRAFVEVARADTKSFHLGDAVVTIDVEHAGPAPDLLARVEERANEIVWEDRAVSTRWMALEEALRLPLRKPPDVEGLVRIVEVDAYDWSACGGTHVARTGQVGLVHILGTERYKGGVRVSFVCGGRALRRLRESGALLRGLALEFTSGEADLPKAVARLKEERAALERRLKPLLKDSLDREAATLLETAPTGACGPVVALHFPDRDAGELGPLAAGVVSRGGIALLLATEPGGGSARAHFAAPQGTISMGALLGALSRRHGGKGGGRPESAQGSFPADRVPLALNEARNAALTGPDSELLA